MIDITIHGDRLTGKNSVLVWRDYGTDILSRVRAAGFSSAEFVDVRSRWFGFGRLVVFARR